MSVKDKTKEELEEKVEELESIIARKGVGSDYLEKAERVQRDVNLALLLGGAAMLLGLSAWTIYKLAGD